MDIGKFLWHRYEVMEVTGASLKTLSDAINQAIKRESEPSAQQGMFNYVGRVINFYPDAGRALSGNVLIEWSVYHKG